MSQATFTNTTRVLNALATARAPLTLDELGRRCGMRRPALERLVAMLNSHGWVTRCGETITTGETLRDWGLSSLLPDALPDRAAPFLQRLFERTGLDVGLAVYAPPEVVFVKLFGFTKHPNAPHLGMPYPAATMAVGRCILASYSEAYVEAFASRFLDDWSTADIAIKLHGPVQQVRERGHGFTGLDRIGFVEAICMPIFAANNDAIGALNIWRPVDQIESDISEDLRNFVPILQHTAGQISSAMGATRTAF